MEEDPIIHSIITPLKTSPLQGAPTTHAGLQHKCICTAGRRPFLNGDGLGKGTHLSFFLVLMRGPFDALLTWLFKQKVMLTLINQEAHHRQVHTLQFLSEAGTERDEHRDWLPNVYHD